MKRKKSYLAASFAASLALMLAVSGCSGKTAETAAPSTAAETLTEGNASAAEGETADASGAEDKAAAAPDNTSGTDSSSNNAGDAGSSGEGTATADEGSAAASSGSSAVVENGAASAEGETAVPAEAEGTAASTGALSAGNYIDSSENHLSLFYLTKEDGYDKDGWAVMAILEDTLYSGEPAEEDNTLAGELTSYKEDMSPDQTLKVTITASRDHVLLRTEDGTEYDFGPDDTDYAALAGEMLPFFQYNQLYAYRGFNNQDAAAYDYLSFEKEKGTDPNHALIPYVHLIAIDDTNEKDVLMYGDYWLWEFEKQDDVLVAVSGGHCPGIIHAERFGEPGTGIYSANSMEEGFTDDDVKTLMGEHYWDYLRITSDQEAREQGMAQVIADYVSANDLPVTKYQMPGEEPKELPPSRAGKMHEKIDLPAFAPAKTAADEVAIYRYLIEQKSEMLSADERDVTLPYAVFIAKDESNPQDIQVLLDGGVCCYNLEDTVLEMQSATNIAGLAHLKKTADGYEVTSFEDVMDGDDYEKEAKRLFGKYYGEFINLSEEKKEAVRKQIIKDYVNENGLDVTAVKDVEAEAEEALSETQEVKKTETAADALPPQAKTSSENTAGGLPAQTGSTGDPVALLKEKAGELGEIIGSNEDLGRAASEKLQELVADKDSILWQVGETAVNAAGTASQKASDFLASAGITEDHPLVQSVNEALSQAGLHAFSAGTNAEEEDEYEAEPIPPYVLNMTEEEDRLISGELKGREYVNEYFGFRLSLPEGWSMSDLVADNADEPLSIHSAYEKGYNCIFLMAENSRNNDTISILITGMQEDKRGMTEEELIRENIELFRQIDETMGEESKRHAENVLFAGKKHPAAVESGSYEGEEWETTSFEIPNDPFSCSITVTSHELPSRVLLSCFRPV